ncbi:hypothetical protein RHS03_02607, partial [Rhizoctonia solani]
MDNTISHNSTSCYLPIELTTLIIGFLQDRKSDLATAALASRTFHFAVVPRLYAHINFSHISNGSRVKWVKTIALWTRTLNSNKYLASLVETLNLHVPESDLPVLYRRILGALLACVNLQELEIWHASHNTPVSWIFPEQPTFALHKLVSYIPASTGIARVLESQPSIRTLRLETFTLRLPISRGSLPYLTHYAGPSKLIVQARAQGDVWEHLVHAELQDAYRPMTGMLDAMPHLKSLDIVVAGWTRDAFQEIAKKCQQLSSLTIRDANGLFHSWQDGRLIRFATTPSFMAGLSAFEHLSSLTINAPYPLYHGRAPASTEKAQLMAWHTHCPTLRHFVSPTGLEWVFIPDSSATSSADDGPAGQWLVIGGDTTLSQNSGTFAIDPGMFGMRRAGDMRERASDDNVDELIAIIERLNREHIADFRPPLLPGMFLILFHLLARYRVQGASTGLHSSRDPTHSVRWWYLPQSPHHHDTLVDSTRVFLSNRAEIKRRVNLGLKGKTTSISGDYHLCTKAPCHDQLRATTSAINIGRTLDILRNEGTTAQELSEFHRNYGRTLDSKSINIEGVQRVLDFPGPRQLAVVKRIQELHVEITKAQEELNEVTWRAGRGTAITVTGDSVELLLTYVVFDASWTSLDDVRASIGKTYRGSSAVAVHYRASITQKTGGNWSDMAIALSASSP